MGINMFTSGSRYDRNYDSQNAKRKNVNPDSRNFSILEKHIIGKYIVVKIKYHDCVNYEGNKILLYLHTSYMNCLSKYCVDPHFSGNKEVDPLARFEPTNEGWAMACSLAVYMEKHF